MRKFFNALVLAVLLTGCSSLIPKRVELGQDKVEKMPVPKSSEREVQRQTAQRAAQKTEETLLAALAEKVSVSVLAPAEESTVLAKAISTSLGPPLTPAPSDVASVALARKLDTAVAKLNSRLDDFREDNDKNAGKKIENTGFLQIPYVVWAGGAVGIFVILFIVGSVAWSFLKMYSMSNPPVALGLKAISTGGALASKAVSQLVAGGEKFKERVEKELPALTEEARDQVLKLFVSSHEKVSDQDVKSVVDHLTK